MRPAIWLTFLLLAVLLVLLPLAFGQLMLSSFAKLHVSPQAAVALMMAMLLGGFVNVPVQRIVRDEWVSEHPFALFGLADVWPQLRRVRRETIIAVNLGGCIVPTALVLYELAYLGALGWPALWRVAVAAAANVFVCYLVARPVPGIGIVMPGLLSALIAATLALALAPEQAAPTAYVAGVVGPLVGADLLHLKDMRAGPAGVLSIGGAGTFDGIVLSGIVAAYLA